MNVKSLPTLALLLALIGSALANDWPQWRGPDRTDVSKEKGLLPSWPKGGPKLLWTFRDAGNGYSSPAIVGDRLYSMGADKEKEHVFALDLTTQKKAWSTEVGPTFLQNKGDGPRGTPTVDGGLIYAIGGQGNLVCVKADTGEKVWQKALKQDVNGAMMSGWGYSESPLVDGDQVVATPGGSKGTVAAFNKKTGELLWQSAGLTDPAAYSSLIAVEFGGVRQYILMTGKSVAGVAAADGKLLWRVDRNGPVAPAATPIFSNGYVYVSSAYDAGCDLVKLTGEGAGIKAEKIYQKNKNMFNHHGGVLLVGDHLYGCSGGNGQRPLWVCQELKTGEVVWKEPEATFGKGSLTCAGGHLYCYSESDGSCVLVEASPKAWKESGRFKVPEQTKLGRNQGKIWTHPVVSNGRLYLRDQELIFCYDVAAKSS